MRNMFRRSRTASSAPSRSALFTTKRSAISRIPAFDACTASPHPGWTTTSVVSAAVATSTSACPTPTVSTMIRSFPDASRMRIASGAASAIPPR